MKKIEYEVRYHKSSGTWVLWKFQSETYDGHGTMFIRKICEGTKKECLKRKKELEKND